MSVVLVFLLLVRKGNPAEQGLKQWESHRYNSGRYVWGESSRTRIEI